jgi:ArsR family metal-binding transcriptional regulator
LYVYDNNDIIAKVYSLYRKGGDGDTYITDEENAEDLLDELMDEADDMVNDAKLNVD